MSDLITDVQGQGQALQSQALQDQAPQDTPESPKIQFKGSLDTPEDTPKEQEPLAPGETFEYDSTGDAGLDYALKFVGDLGYGPGHPAIQAAEKGDFALIRADLARKGVQGAEAVIALAENAYKNHEAKTAENQTKLQAVAEEAAGGPENWNLVRTWASANATPEEKAAVNSALAQGGFVAKAVVQELVSLYQGSNTLPQEARSPVQPNAGYSQPNAAEPLTAQAYAKAVQALRVKLGNRVDDSPEYEALSRQRIAARNAGY